MNPQTPIERIRWLEAKNTSADEIPAFAVVRVVSIATDRVYTVAKPDTDSQAVIAFNGPTVIPASTGFGVITMDGPADALYESADGTPAVGESWGAGASSFKLRKDKTGVTIAGGVTDGRVQVVKTGGGGASLTVKETDATPSVSNVDEIRFHSDDFVLTDLTGGDVQVKTKGFTGSQDIVTNVTCTTVTKKTFVWKDGLLVSIT